MVWNEKNIEYTMPLLDCLLPVSNSEAYLEECLDSLLAQSFEDFKLLIFDDASTDGSRSIIEKYKKKDARIELFSCKKSKGIPAALNTLIKKAKAKYLAIQLPEDTSHKERFAKQIDRLQNSSLIALGSSLIWDGRLVGEEKQEVLCTENPKDVLVAQMFSKDMRGIFIGTAMYKTAAIKKNPPLDTKLAYYYDIEFHARLQKNYPFRIANLKEPLYTMRIFHGCIQEKVNNGKIHIDKAKILSKSLPYLEYIKSRYFDNILMTHGYAPY